MSSVQSINDKLFLEAFNIITSNKSKANFVRQSLLQNLSYDNDSNSKVIGFLGELEFDLKSLYDIIKDIQLSQNETQNNYYSEPINEEKKEIGKTYSIVTQKSGNGNKNNFSKINSYYINSPINKDLNRTMQRSSSCNEFLFNNEEKSDNAKLIRNRYNYLNNLKEREKNNNLSSSKVLSPKLNFDYDAYFTDYSLNKTSKNSLGSYFDFLNKNSNKLDKSQNANYEMSNKENLDNNNKECREINNYTDYRNKNIFTFSEQKNKNSKEELNNNIIPQKNSNINTSNNNNAYFTDDNNFNYPRTYVYQRRSKEEEELEKQKKEIIKNIISDIFQDVKKLNLLKKELGDDIGEKLLSGKINEKELYKVVEILKKNQENIMKRKKVIQKKKFNQPSDKILLREKLNNKRYNFREYPRGWSSTKDYFINNGTTYIRNKRFKK